MTRSDERIEAESNNGSDGDSASGIDLNDQHKYRDVRISERNSGCDRNPQSRTTAMGVVLGSTAFCFTVLVLPGIDPSVRTLGVGLLGAIVGAALKCLFDRIV